VQEGDPELLFIKRAGRAGDRWSGHVALPGGKRDPEDEDDLAAAIRETREEIGVDLETADCLQAGNLPERLVTTSWGRDVLMVLCPYIFLLTGKNVPPVQPQPTEVAAVHWVSLRALLSPTLRTREAVDISARWAKRVGPTFHKLIRLTMGRMMFSAVRLLPTESVYASSIPDFIPKEGGDNLSTLSGWAQAPFGVPSSNSGHNGLLTFQQPLILWGLTLGVLADLLDQLPPYNAVALWKYPTFTVPDLRIIVYLMTRQFRKNTAEAFSSGSWYSQQQARQRRRPSQTAMDGTSQAIAISSPESMPAMGPESSSIAVSDAAEEAPTTQKFAKRSSFNKHSVGIGGLGVGKSPDHAVGKLLYGYYDRVNWAIAVFLAYRTVLTAGTAWWIIRWWRRRRAARL
jgi:8-oxo-dGTP pyrophosphatase MutT (NUDIX family)